MPSTTFNASGADLPRAAEGANSQYRDEVLDGLLAFLRHYISTSVQAKVAEMGGPTSSSAISDPCPTANLFPWNHNNTFMRPHNRAGSTNALPGLWMWCESREATQDAATLWHREVALWTLRADYIFPEVSIPDGYTGRSGLLADVDRAVQKASRERRHSTFTPSGGAQGTGVCHPINLMGFVWVSSREAMLAAHPGGTIGTQGGRPSSEGTVQRFFPALQMTFRAWARVGSWEPSVPGDALSDSTITINVGDDPTDAIENIERILPPPIETVG